MRSGRQAAVGLTLVAMLAPAAAPARGPMPTSESASVTEVAEPFSYSVAARQMHDVADGDVVVRADMGAPAPESAYAYLRVSLANMSPQPQPVALAFSGHGGETLSRAVDLAPGERRTVVLPVPATVSSGTLWASGPGIFNGGRQGMYFPRPTLHLMLVVGSAESFQKLMTQAPDTSGSHNTTVMFAEPNELADEVAAYLGFDEVLLLDSSLSSFDEGPRAALEAYTALGGALVFTHPLPHPETYLPLWPKDRSTPVLAPYGFGTVAQCEASDCAASVKGVMSAEPLPVHPRGSLPPGVRRSAYPAVTLGSTWTDQAFLLPEAIAPLGQFLLIIAAFTLAIGPGSFWVARRRGAPAVLVFIPGTALLTCLCLIGYSLVHDGFTLHSATRSLTLLDRKNGRAVTLGLEAFYANLAPAGAQLDTRTALIFPGGSEQTASIDWTHGLKLGSNFIPSRTYREWGVVSVQPTRARLMVQPSPVGPPRVRNALGATVRLAHFSFGGKLWRVAGLTDGAEGIAMAMESAEPLPAAGIREFENRFAALARAQVKGPLGEGEFLADLEGPGFLPMGGLAVKHDNSEALVRGRFDEP